MANRVRPIVVNEADRAELERWQRASSTPVGLSRRARAILLMAQGLSGVDIAERIGYTIVQVSRIRRRFAQGGVAGLPDRPKSGRPPTVTARKRARVVALTLKPPPQVSHIGRPAIWLRRRGCRTPRCNGPGPAGRRASAR
jgi:DNA-binding CsgD family transcriptional regulator